MHLLISVKIYRNNIASKRRQLAEGRIGEISSVIFMYCFNCCYCF